MVRSRNIEEERCRKFPPCSTNASTRRERWRKIDRGSASGYNHELCRQSPVAVSAADLQRKLSPNCNATRSARCARQTAFAASHYPLPTAGLFRTRHRSNMQCENGNLKVVSAAALNTSFRIDIWNERSIWKGVRAVWSVAGECRWSGRQRRCRGSPSECDRRGRARNLWRRAREARRR